MKGTVKGHGHNAVTATFKIGGLTVVYNNNTIIGDMPTPSGSNWDGRFVEVKGTNFIIDAGVPTLLATKVEPENDGVGKNDMDEFEVEGFVTQAGTPNGKIIDFTIETTQIRTTANTEFRGGTIDEIVVGVKMSAEGRFDGTALIAKHVKFHESARLEGNIASIDLIAKTLKIAGLLEVTVNVNSQTEFKASGGVTITDLNDLQVGNHVRVRGRVGNNDSVIATRVQLRSFNPEKDVDLQGQVQEAPSDPFLKILGVAVNTTGVEFEGLDDGPISRTAFFNAVKEGTLVKVKGRLSGESVTWREAELED